MKFIIEKIYIKENINGAKLCNLKKNTYNHSEGIIIIF